MCGIAGIYNLKGVGLPRFNPHHVLETLRHRGPDDEGLFTDERVFLGVRRLAIIDPAHGRQPVTDESGRFHLVMNGEIFDYDLLMDELKGRGHVFHSHCDTEVALHLVEEQWAAALDRLDGQFAIAAYDARENRLLLARDRMGICPLFYAQAGDYLVFASEMKAIFATGLVRPEIDRRSLDAVALFNCVPAPRTVFRGVRQLPPGRFIEIKNGVITEHTYWDIPFNEAGQYPRKSERQWAEELRDVLARACRRHLKADVPVGLYLSGGIDSSTVAAMTADVEDLSSRVFSIGFPEPGFDETAWTKAVADYLGLHVHALMYHQKDLARDIDDHVYYGETPLLSTEGVPLMALSKLASQHVKVVLTGEGSDESFGGYEYFRWDAFRQWSGSGLWGKICQNIIRPGLAVRLGRHNVLFPDAANRAYTEELFGFNPSIMQKFAYFRLVREVVYPEATLARQEKLSDAEFVDLPRDRMRRWDLLNRTLYISSRIFMTNHLLGSHGDRAVMAHSVEGRHPFLDRPVQEFLGTVPPTVKTRWTSSKHLLRKTMAHRLPREVTGRRKKMFLAPFGTPFVGTDSTDQIRDLLRPERIAEFGFFDPAKVQRITAHLESIKEHLGQDRASGFRLDRHVIERTVLGMAMNFVVTTQILEDQIRRGRFGGSAGRIGAAVTVSRTSSAEV
jgi:asparagine synthase (glutamine-hydrolysing)